MNQRAAPDADDVRVLFVEDDVSVAQMYRLKLELDGYTVEVAGDGLVALEKAKTMHPDIIFLDIRLREPFDIGERVILVVRVGDDRNPLPAELRKVIFLLRIDEEADLLAADIRILIKAGEEREEVHLHRDLP